MKKLLGILIFLAIWGLIYLLYTRVMPPSKQEGFDLILSFFIPLNLAWIPSYMRLFSNKFN